MLDKTAAPFLFVLLSAWACHSPGPYGHSVDYAPFDEEETAL
jgi:hypothetical protein